MLWTVRQHLKLTTGRILLKVCQFFLYFVVIQFHSTLVYCVPTLRFPARVFLRPTRCAIHDARFLVSSSAFDFNSLAIEGAPSVSHCFVLLSCS